MEIEWRALSQKEKQPSSSDFPPLIERLLNIRGYDTEDKRQEFLKASLNKMRSPFTIRDMDRVVKRIYQAYQEQEKVLIYGDFDLDGTSAIAVLIRGLKKLGFKHLAYFQPLRLSDGYGLHPHFIEEFAEQGISLVISVDVGITAIEAAKKAKELGLDLIISDHHQPKEILPDAYAILNPNRKDCESGLGHLCGAGVAYYLMLALKIYWDENKSAHDFNAKDVLEYFTIGTLTDMVPMLEENRALAKHGILQIQNTDKVGLRVLLETLGFWGRPLSSQDVAIGIAPKLNALSRMEENLLPIDILLEEKEDVARSKMKKVLELNDRRKSLQKAAEEEAEEEYLASGGGKFAFVYSKNFHKGIIGLVATKLSQKYNVAAFVGSIDQEGNIHGSARAPNIEGFSLLDVYEDTSEALKSFGGHHFASGFHLRLDQADKWKKLLKGYFENRERLAKDLLYDLKVNLAELNIENMKWLDQLQPFGVAFESPLFLIENLEITALKSLRGGHLRFALKGEGASHTALSFSPPPHFEKIKEGDRVDILTELQWNYYNARKSLQLLLKDIRKHER